MAATMWPGAMSCSFGSISAQHHDLEQVRALLGHTRIDTTQIYTSIRPPQLKRAVSFYEEQAARMLTE